MRARGQEPRDLSPATGLSSWESPTAGLLTLSSGFHPLSCLDLGRGCTRPQSGPVEKPVHRHLPLFHTGRELLGTAMNLGLQAQLSKDLGAWWPIHLLQHFFLHCSFMTPAIGDCAHPDKPEEPSGLATSGVPRHNASCPQPKKHCFHGSWPSKGQDLAASSSWLRGN